jgi:hypothetical protein
LAVGTLTGSVSVAPFEYEYHFIEYEYEYEYEYEQEQPFLVTTIPGKQRKVVPFIVGDRSLVGYSMKWYSYSYSMLYRRVRKARENID